MRKILFPLLLITLAIGFFAIWIYGADYYNVVIIDTTTKKATWYFSGDIKVFTDLDKSTTSFEVNGGTVTTQRVQIESASSYIDIDGSGNLIFYDAVTGEKTLAELVGSFTNPGWENFFSTSNYRVQVDTDFYSTGYGSFTYVYGDGSQLTNISGSGVPGGSTNDIQYKDSGGDFAGTSNFTWDGTTVTVVGGVNASSNVYSGGYFIGDGSQLTNITGAGVPGGSATHVQYKDGAGNFAGDSDFTFDGDTVTLAGLSLSTGSVTRLTMVTGTATDLTIVTGTATDFTSTNVTATTSTLQYLTYSGTMTFKPSADYDDYLQLFSDSNAPAFYVSGDPTLRLKTSDDSQTIFELYKDDDNRFQIAVTSASNYTHIYSDQPLYLYASGDQSNYFMFRTVSDIPEISGVGSEHLTIKSGSGSIDFDDENLLTSGLVDGVDVSDIPSTYLTQSSAAATYWQTVGWEQYFSESGGVVTDSTSTVFSQKVSIGTTTVTDVGLRVGNGTDSHSLGTTDDVYIAGRLEVDTTTYIDSNLYLYNGASKYGKIRHDGTYLELSANTYGIEIPTHAIVSGELQVSSITALSKISTTDTDIVIDSHTKFTGQVYVDTITYNNSTEYVYIPTNTYTVGYVSATYFYGDATYLTNVATAAHTHDGNTLQLDGISSDGGDFNFGTSGSITFKVCGDTNDYLELSTLNNLPQVKVIGDSAIRFKSDSTDTILRLEDYADSADYTSLIMNHAQNGGGILSTDEKFYFKLNEDTDDYMYFESSANKCYIAASGTELRLGKTADGLIFSNLGYFNSPIASGLTHRFRGYGLDFSTYSNTLPGAGWESSSCNMHAIAGPAIDPGYYPRLYLVYNGDDDVYRWVFWNYKFVGGFTGAMNIQANRYYMASDTTTYMAQNGTSIGLSTHTIVTGSMTITEAGLSINGVEYSLPATDGSSGEVLHTDGAGTLTWDTDDQGAGGASTLQVKVASVEVSSPTASIDFVWGFTGTESPSTEANITLDTDTLTAEYYVLNPATAALNMNSQAITGAATLDTGQGAYELYAMNQDVLTTSSPTFSSCTITNSMSINGVDYTFPSSDGSNGEVLHTDGAGTLTWDTDDGAGSGDNLGNHVATTTLNMAGFDISTIDEIDIASMTTTTNDVIYIASNTYTTGYSSQTNTYSQSYSIGSDTLDTTEFAYIDGIDQSVATTNAVTFATVDTGNGAYELFAMNQDVESTDAVTFATVDTGNGAYELFAMNQDVESTDDVDFVEVDIASITTSQNDVIYIPTNTYTTGYSSQTTTYSQSYAIGADVLDTTEFSNLDGLDQSLATTDAVTFATIDTGQGANELYDMDQNVTTNSTVTFSSCTLNHLRISSTFEWAGLNETNISLNPQQAKLPSSNPAVIDASENNWRLLFDDATDESATWDIVIDDDYDSGTLYADLYFTMTSSTGTDVVWNVSIMAVTAGDSADINTDSYDSVNISTETIPATAGYLDKTTVTLTNDDSLAAGDYLRIKISRDADSGDDTANGDAELIKAVIRE